MQECAMPQKGAQFALVGGVPASVESDLLNAETIRVGLECVLARPQFAKSPRASRFLRYIVEAALAGRRDCLKEYVLGVEVFDRAPSFDPRVDTIVRVEAVKLRGRLAQYYRGPGRKESVIIDMPKGGYAPDFRLRSHRASVRPLPINETRNLAVPVSVAVLPFANLSADPDQAYWSDGLTDELTSALSRIARLRTVSRTSAFVFKGKAVDVRLAGRMLCADVVVEGSVRMQARRVRVSAQLIEVSTGLLLWSDIIERETQDAWAVQEEIAAAIMAAVKLELTPEESKAATKNYIPNPEAFELYLKGRYAVERMDYHAQVESVQLFQRASFFPTSLALTVN